MYTMDKEDFIFSLHFLKEGKLHLTTYEFEKAVICEALSDLQKRKTISRRNKKQQMKLSGRNKNITKYHCSVIFYKWASTIFKTRFVEIRMLFSAEVISPQPTFLQPQPDRLFSL